MRYRTLIAVALFTLVGFAGHGLAGVIVEKKADNTGAAKTTKVAEADVKKAAASSEKLTNWQKSDQKQLKANKDGLINENDCYNCGYTNYVSWNYSWSWVSYDIWQPVYQYVWSWTPTVFTWTYYRPHVSSLVYAWAPRYAPCQYVVF